MDSPGNTVAKNVAPEDRLPGRPHVSGWKDQLQGYIRKYNHLRADGSKASHKTQSDRANYLFKFFIDIRALGYKVDPKNLGERHIRAICKKYEKDGLSAATFQTYISFLRVFCIWIGKPGMIKAVSQYFTDPQYAKRSYAATKDKSWDVPHVDKMRIIHEILSAHPYIGHQLLMEDAFGLRRKESIMIRPFMCERDGNLHIIDGAKGGKSRVIPIEDEYQREILDRVKAFLGNTSRHLGDPDLTLVQNLYRFSNVVKKYGIKKSGKGALGITAHGLRAGFAMNQMEKRGLTSVLRGGEIGQLPPEVEHQIRVEVSRLLGHNRPEVTTAYSGARSQVGLSKVRGVMLKALSKAIQAMEPGCIYRFQTVEHEIGTYIIPAGMIEREFIGMNKADDENYVFEVRSRRDGPVQTISLGIVDAIEKVE